MKAYEIGAQDGISSLRLAEKPDLVAGPGQAVLKVRAACLNHRDLLVLAGTYGARRPETRVPVSDGIGEVVSIGPGVSNIAEGDRATTVHFASWIDGAFSMAAFGHDLGITHDGWLAEHILVPAAALVKIPDGVSDERAVALPAAGVTAWNAVVETGGLTTLSQSIAAAAVNGRIAIIGALAGPSTNGLPNFSTIIGKNLTLRGIAEGSRAMLAALVRAVETNGMKPVTDRGFPFDQAAEAYAYLKSGQHLGKVLIRM